MMISREIVFRRICSASAICAAVSLSPSARLSRNRFNWVHSLVTTFANPVRRIMFGTGSGNRLGSSPISPLMMTERTRSKVAKVELEKIQLENIETWTTYYQELLRTKKTYAPNIAINNKVSLFQGDITNLEIDAIVNAANEALLGGGGVDGAIHKAAGEELLEECEKLNGCDPGDAKITGGYKLPAKHVIHTVGPRGEKQDVLRSCYRRCFELLLENKLKTIAFPCISTGIFGYPREHAAHVALKETRAFLEAHCEDVDRVIFCVFLNEDLAVYEKFMQTYFPVCEHEKGAPMEQDQQSTQD